MSDSLYRGSRFRLFNVIDDFNRESLVIEVDTSLRAARLVRHAPTVTVGPPPQPHSARVSILNSGRP